MNAPRARQAPLPVKLTVEHVRLLDESGALAGLERTELIDGRLYCVNSIGSRHARANGMLFMLIQLSLTERGSSPRAMVSPTISMPSTDAPMPDVAVAAPASEGRYVPASDVALAAEVADTTLADALGPKRHLYARHIVPEYWVVDLPNARLHQFWAPADGAYTQERVVALAGPLASATLPDLAIDGAALF